MPRNTTDSALSEYINYYDVTTEDPQLMGHFSERFNHAKFHAEYANKALRAKRIRYTKSNCGDVATAQYFEQIVNRVQDTAHLAQFKLLLDTLMTIRNKLD